MTDTIIPVQTEYEKLLETVRKLRARVIELTAERDDLLYHICPALQAKYDEKIGSERKTADHRNSSGTAKPTGKALHEGG